MTEPVASRDRRAPFAGLTLLVALLAAAPGLAAETLVESLDGVHKFATLWPGGTFELGSDSGYNWARIVTDGQGGSSVVANVRPYTPTIDATGKFVKVTIKIDDLAKLGGMEFRLSSDRFSSSYYAFSFPIYDDADFNIVRDAVWTTLTFSFGTARIEGKPDRSQINSIGWYVADKGNAQPVTAYWSGLFLVDEPAEGVVSLTFDDGWSEHLVAAKLMAEHGMRGTAYIIPNAVGRSGYLGIHQLVDLQETYGWDVAAHHETPFTEMRPDELENVILGIQRFLIENQFRAGAAHLAYPLGKQNTSLVRPLVRKYFATARVASSGPETLPPADPHLLRVLNVTAETRPKEIGAAARRARDDKEWLILMFHHLVEKPKEDLEYSMSDFKKMLAEIDEAKVRVVPLAQVWEACDHNFAGPTPSGVCDFKSAVAAPKP